MLCVRTNRLGLFPAAQALLARRAGNRNRQAGEILARHALARTGSNSQLGNDAQVSQILTAAVQEGRALLIGIDSHACLQRLANRLFITRALKRLVHVIAERGQPGPLLALLLGKGQLFVFSLFI